jgi:hypothetical protein
MKGCVQTLEIVLYYKLKYLLGEKGACSTIFTELSGVIILASYPCLSGDASKELPERIEDKSARNIHTNDGYRNYGQKQQCTLSIPLSVYVQQCTSLYKRITGKQILPIAIVSVLCYINWMVGGSNSVGGGGEFFIFQNLLAISGFPKSLFVRYRNSLPWVKGRVVKVTPSSAEIQNMWIYTSTPLYTFVARTGTPLSS